MASPIDDLTDDELNQLMALPEAERNAVINQLASAPPPDITMGAPDPAAPVRSEADYYREVMSPEFQAAKEAGLQAGAAQAAPEIAKDLGTAALIGTGIGAVGMAGRGALRLAAPYAQPIARGVVAAAKTYARLSPAGRAIKEGVKAAAPKLEKSVTARISHALGQAAKAEAKAAEIPAAATKPVSTGAMTATPIAPRATTTLPSVAQRTPKPEEVAQRIRELSAAKYERGQMAEILRSELAPGGKGIGTGYFKQMIDAVLGPVKKGS